MFSHTFLVLASVLITAVSTAWATNVHANSGCILVDNNAVCWPNSIPISDGAATIYARFNGADRVSPETNAGCKLDATWPTSYGAVFFGADNCLYDGNGQNIGGQCCDVGTGGTSLVPNPYVGQ